MKRARKSNKVSWASNLYQTKSFTPDNYPSKVGQKLQDHLQAKTSSSLLHSSTNESNDLPPGFESSHFLNQRKVEFSCISQIKWECPPQFVFSSHWSVAAGEESKEKEHQKQREMRVLEAFYPRISAIPTSPSVSLDVEEEDYDDNNTPLIPLIPIEEEESMDIMPESTAAMNPPPNVQSSDAYAMPFSGVSPGSDADLASVVVAAILKSNEQGSLVDMDMLSKIFNDPKMIENMINVLRRIIANTASASSNTEDATTSRLKPYVTASGITLSSTVKSAIPSVSMVIATYDKLATVSVPLSRTVSGKPVSPSDLLHTPTPSPTPHISIGMPIALDPVLASGVKARTGSACAIKNANYYKNLIRQHGVDKQDSRMGIRHSSKQGEVKHKVRKPCRYFGSSKGCRNGSNCPYLHDVSVQLGAGIRARNAKKLKL